MRKLYISLATLCVAVISINAQNNESTHPEYLGVQKTQGVLTQVDNSHFQGLVDAERVVDVWVNDFTTPTDWAVGNASSPEVDWVIGTAPPAGDFSDGMGAIASTSGGNFALFDSDAIGSGSSAQDSWVQNATPIDLSTYPNVLLTFESYYRAFQGNTYAEVSSNGTDWISTEVHTDLAVNASSENPALIILDVSSTIGGSATAYVRFRYIGGWDYAWMVDDVKIVEQLANDLKMNYSVVSHQVATGIEYGHVVSEQLAEIAMGSEFMNFGTEIQTNCSVEMVMTDNMGAEVFNSSTAGEDVAPGDTAYVELVDSSISWSDGNYSTEFTLTSDDEEPDASSFDNNVDSRVFAISNVYAMDGIDVYPDPSQGSIGTTSFTDATDGLMLFSQYEIVEDQDFFGLEILLNTAGTDPGASIYAAILTFEDVNNDIVNDGVWQVSSEEYEITAQDISNGYVNLLFEDTWEATPGSYFAAVQVNSFGNASDIAILDDNTIPQPTGASLIYIENDAVYSNGNAFAIRLMKDEQGSLVGVEDVAQINLVGQNVPNPAMDDTRIDFELLSSQPVMIQVTDVTGKIVLEENLGTRAPGLHQYMLDVRSLSAGPHIYSIITNQGIAAKKMSVVK